MNQTLVRIGIGIVCLPMVFVFWLMLSAHWTKMDTITMKLPMSARSMVASVIVQSRSGDRTRAKRLDPEVEIPVYLGSYSASTSKSRMDTSRVNSRQGQTISTARANSANRPVTSVARSACTLKPTTLKIKPTPYISSQSTKGVQRYFVENI